MVREELLGDLERFKVFDWTVCQSFSLSEKSEGLLTPVWSISVLVIISGGIVLSVKCLFFYDLEYLVIGVDGRLE